MKVKFKVIEIIIIKYTFMTLTLVEIAKATYVGQFVVNLKIRTLTIFKLVP